MTKEQDVLTMFATLSDNGSTGRKDRQCRLQLRSTMSFVLCMICCLLSQGCGVVSAFNMAPSSTGSNIRRTSTSTAVPTTLSLLQITGGYQKQTMKPITVRKQQQQQQQQKQQVVAFSQPLQSSVRIMERDSTESTISKIIQSLKVRTIGTNTNVLQVSVVALVLAAAVTVAILRSTTTIAPTMTIIIGSLTSALSVAGTSIDTFWRNFPYIAAGLTCGFKATAADIVAQRRQQQQQSQQQQQQQLATATADQSQQQNNKIDWKRTTAYLLYGAFYQGMTQEHVYNHLYPIWFGIGTNIQTVVTKVLFDVTIQTLFFTLPFAYFAKACIYQLSFRTILKQYIDDILHEKLLLKYIALWAPVNMLTFSIIPVHYRVTWIACISFIWMIILSSIASRQRPTTVK